MRKLKNLLMSLFHIFQLEKKEMKSLNGKKKYKALILDVDGTIIPKKRHGFPSRKLTEAILKANKVLHVGVATSRPYSEMPHIVKNLQLSGPSIISSGAQIIYIESGKIIKEQLLNREDVGKVGAAFREVNVPFFIYDNGRDYEDSETYIPNRPLEVYALGVLPKIADKIVEKISDISTVSVHRVPSWRRHRHDILVTHAYATKQHGILEVARILGISTHEIIGVGDGYNDFPLLMACGLKIAMGNAVEDLKEIADYVAPPVEEDGVAHVIDKFVLHL